MLQDFSPSSLSEGDDLYLLCPVRALKMYVDRSSQWRKSLQLLVCFGAGHNGLATSKHTISHWVRDAISIVYEVLGLPSPLDIRAHSTRGVASSQALFRGVPLEDICSIILMWTQLLAPRFFLFEPAVFWCSGLYWVRSGSVLAWGVRYIVPTE